MVVTLTPFPDFPMVRPGDDLAELVIAACDKSALAPADGDVLVVAQKIVSKAEGRYVDLAEVRPSARAQSLAADVDKDPRLVEVILAESRRVVRQRLVAHFHTRLAVIVTDSWGRAWRRGTAGVALGAAGLPALMDMRGRPDLFGHELRVTQTGFADEIASAASLIMGQADEARPTVLVRGLSWSGAPSPAAALIRSAEEDLFR